MEMKQILEQLEGKLKQEKTQVEGLEKNVEAMMKALEEAEKELKVRKDNVGSLEMMIEAAKEGHFGLTEKTEAVKAEVKKIENPAIVKSDANATKKGSAKNPEWKHKDAFVVKLNEYNNVEDRWRTQKAAARSLGWDQSSVCKFMKLNRDQQLQRKGFALVWEY